MFTRETLNEVQRLTAEIKSTKEHASELLRVAQDRFGHRKHKFTREGKEVEITEKTLWNEVWYLIPETTKFMRGLHPEVFEAYDKQDAAANELKKFCLLEMGFDFTAMTIGDYLKMTEGLFNLLLEEKKVAVFKKEKVAGEPIQDSIDPYVAPIPSPLNDELKA